MSKDRSTTVRHYATRRFMQTIVIYDSYLSDVTRKNMLPGNDSIVFDAMKRSPFGYGLRGILYV